MPPTATVRRLLPALATVALLALTACTSTVDPPPPAPTSTVVVIPDTAVGQKMRWLLGVLNDTQDTSADQWTAELDSSFVAQVPAEQLVRVINEQVRPAGPFTITAYEENGSRAVATVRGAVGTPLRISLGLNDAGKIVELFVSPAQQEHVPAQSLDEVAARLRALPGDVRVLVQRADGATVHTLVEIDSDEPAPLASVFKLYVLLAVATAIDAGHLSWDETVTVTDANRSLPSGDLQNAPSGTAVTIRTAAQKMISISDNTATDLLIARVGRENVEAAVAAAGHHDPALLRPFLTTREYFTLGWGEPELTDQWSAADEPARRAILDGLGTGPLAVTVADVTGAAVWPDRLDWFASAQDVTAAHRALHALDDPVIRDILGANPGVESDRTAWPFIAFKGGSSLGVLTGSWLAEAGDGTVLTVVFLAASEDVPALTLAQDELVGLAADTLRLAGA